MVDGQTRTAQKRKTRQSEHERGDGDGGRRLALSSPFLWDVACSGNTKKGRGAREGERKRERKGTSACARAEDERDGVALLAWPMPIKSVRHLAYMYEVLPEGGGEASGGEGG